MSPSSQRFHHRLARNRVTVLVAVGTLVVGGIITAVAAGIDVPGSNVDVITDLPGPTDAPTTTDAPVVTDPPLTTDPPVVTDPPLATDPPLTTEAPLTTDTVTTGP